MLGPDEWQVVAFSVRLAVLSTLLIVPPCLAVAWLLARRQWRGKAIVETVVVLPLVMPPVAIGLILLRILGRRGPVGGWLHQVFDLDIAFTPRGVIAAMMVMSAPLLVRAARVAFEEVPSRYEQIAGTLGARPLRVFFSITLPLAFRGVLGGMLLAFARALGEFGATVMVAGNIPGRTTTLASAIFNAVELGREDTAMRLLAVSVLAAFVAAWIAETVLRRRGRAT